MKRGHFLALVAAASAAAAAPPAIAKTPEVKAAASRLSLSFNVGRSLSLGLVNRVTGERCALPCVSSRMRALYAGDYPLARHLRFELRLDFESFPSGLEALLENDSTEPQPVDLLETLYTDEGEEWRYLYSDLFITRYGVESQRFYVELASRERKSA